MIWLDKWSGAATKKEKSPETVTFFILPQFKAIENKGILREKSFTFRS